MKINVEISKNEKARNQKLSKVLTDKLNVPEVKEVKDICVAKHGFKFEARVTKKGGYHVEAVVPEWVMPELNGVLIKNLDILISALTALKSGLVFLGYSLKGIKKDIREVFEKHRND